MLGKLLKYEMRSTSRVMWFIYGAVILVGLIIGITLRIETNLGDWNVNTDQLIITGSGSAIAQIILLAFIIVYAVLLVAMGIMTIIMIILRFNNNLLRGEGYLMHTLPVPTWQLVLSKLIIAFVWTVIASVVAIVSALLLGLSSGMLGLLIKEAGFWNLLKEVFENFGSDTVLFIVTAILSSIALILAFYFSMAVGNIANKNKMLLAVGVFIGVQIVISIISTAVGKAAFNVITDYGINLSDLFVRSIVMDAVFSVILFFGTTLILRKRLNLA